HSSQRPDDRPEYDLESLRRAHHMIKDLLDTRQEEAIKPGSLEASNPAQFLYLDQQTVLEADGLNMNRAMDVIAEALCLFETGRCRQPHKVVLRDGDDVSCEDRGRINALFASIGAPMRA